MDFAKSNNHIHFVSSINEIKNASIKTNIGEDEISREAAGDEYAALQGGNKFKLSNAQRDDYIQ